MHSKQLNIQKGLGNKIVLFEVVAVVKGDLYMYRV